MKMGSGELTRDGGEQLGAEREGGKTKNPTEWKG